MKNEIQLHGIAQDIKIVPYEHHTKYHETDQQGIIHHSNFIHTQRKTFIIPRTCQSEGKRGETNQWQAGQIRESCA